MIDSAEPRSRPVSVLQAELDRAAQQQAAIRAFGRRSNARPGLNVLLQDAAALVAEVLEGDFWGISRVTGTRLELQFGAAFGPHPETPPPKSEIALDSSSSMAGFTLCEAASVVTLDLSLEERFRDRLLSEAGAVSSLAVPLHLGEKPFGALGIHCSRRREFPPSDICFAETIAVMLMTSVGRVVAEQRLAQQQGLASAVMENIDSLVVLLDADGAVLDMNRAATLALQRSQPEIAGRSFWSETAPDDEIDACLGRLRATTVRTPQEFESTLIAADGTRRRIAWTLRQMAGDAARLGHCLLSGTDRTEHYEREERLADALQVAAKAAGALEEFRKGRLRDAKAAGADASPQPTSASPPPSRGIEQRASPRRAYRYRQRIAPIRDGKLPTADQFVEVDCHDISAGGISFYLGAAPDFRALVVGLGCPPRLTYFTARVARVSTEDHDGRMQYLVGCQFTSRTRID